MQAKNIAISNIQQQKKQSCQIKLHHSAPNYFQTPNDVVDHWLPHLTGSETKVLLVVYRKTFGWHKQKDRISLIQMQEATGLSKNAVLSSTRSLEEKGVLRKEVTGKIPNQETYYEIVLCEPKNESPERQNKEMFKGSKNEPSNVQKMNIQKTLSQNTKKTTAKEIRAKPKSLSIACSAAASSDIRKEEHKPKIYPCLKDVPLPDSKKEMLTKDFDLPKVERSIAWGCHPTTKIKDTLIAALRWFCNLPVEDEPKPPRSTETIIKDNKEHALEIERTQDSPFYKIEVLSKRIEISPKTPNGPDYSFSYEQENFKELLLKILETKGFQKKETQ